MATRGRSDRRDNTAVPAKRRKVSGSGNGGASSNKRITSIGSAPAPSAVASPRATVHARTYEMGILMGPTGCGKTTGANEIADEYAKQGGKVWAIDPSRAWAGVPNVEARWPSDGLRGLDQMLIDAQGWGPGLLIFDDADKYMRRPTQVRDDYMTSFRHYEKDVMLISRRPQGIPKDAISNAKWFRLYAGSMTEPGARNYMHEVLDAKILKGVPTAEWEYLYLYRVGAVWTSAPGVTRPRAVRTISDKR